MRICPMCKHTFEPKRSDKKTCKPRCQKRLARQKQRLAKDSGEWKQVDGELVVERVCACGQKFLPKRKDAKTCSDVCRKQKQRIECEVIQAELAAPQPVSVIDPVKAARRAAAAEIAAAEVRRRSEAKADELRAIREAEALVKEMLDGTARLLEMGAGEWVN